MNLAQKNVDYISCQQINSDMGKHSKGCLFSYMNAKGYLWLCIWFLQKYNRFFRFLRLRLTLASTYTGWLKLNGAKKRFLNPFRVYYDSILWWQTTDDSWRPDSLARMSERILQKNSRIIILEIDFLWEKIIDVYPLPHKWLLLGANFSTLKLWCNSSAILPALSAIIGQ